ncbi:penicillin-binding transpeptidase domain-containing protein [Lolliginicoccus suaedae]|uniref:penicillin-binding transpeptidase domain-containing protein n=1 Tax=Lolliginicoccus suaedae TaxID=2605429 RepID=UPI0011ECB7B0|nr:penicillin-binding transpeptidase domain-containing protein [Lolliginicoccus suaedae]
MCPAALFPARRRYRAALALALAGMLGAVMLTACEADPAGAPSPLPVIRDFTTALAAGDLDAAASLTTEPSRAGDGLAAIFGALSGNGAEFAVQGLDVDRDEASFTLGAAWDLGESAYGPRRWVFSTTGLASQTSDGWRIVWRPDVIIPGMTDQQTVRLRPEPPPPTEILDRDGAPLLAQSIVHVVTVDPAEASSNGRLAEDLAGLLSPVDPRITPASLLLAINAGQGQEVPVVELRDEDYQPLADQIASMGGVSVEQRRGILTARDDLASPLFAQLRAEWQHRQDVSAGWSVELVDRSGAVTVLEQSPGIPLPDITTELDLDVQLAAQRAVESVADSPAMIVALQSSTGAVLSVAQNPAADVIGPIALAGLYEPGPVFGMVTAITALENRQITNKSTVSCPPEGTYGDRHVANPGLLDLAEVTFAEAFARSCATTIADLATGMDSGELHGTAVRLGLGRDFSIPGMTTVSGTIPMTGSTADRVATALGAGGTMVSPFSMALMAATIARGTTPAPMLLRGRPAITGEPTAGIAYPVLRDAQRLMRGFVETGAAASLAEYRGLIGVTGSASDDAGRSINDWFIGVDGNLAFAVLVTDPSATGAVAVAGRFLDPLVDKEATSTDEAAVITEAPLAGVPTTERPSSGGKN